MGVFERIHAAIENRQVELKRVEELYGYRVSNIWANPCIRKKKLEEREEGWKGFIELTRWLEWQRSTNGNPEFRYPGRENVSAELVPPPS